MLILLSKQLLMVIVTFNVTQADPLQVCHRHLHVAFQINHILSGKNKDRKKQH